MRVDDKTQIGYDILDFLALVETEPSVYSIWNGSLAHGLFEGSALGIGAVEYGYLVVGYQFVVVELAYAAYYGISLIYITICLHEGDGLAYAAVRVDAFLDLSAIVTDEGICCSNDGLGGAVISFEFEESAVGITLLETKYVVDIGSAE